MMSTTKRTMDSEMTPNKRIKRESNVCSKTGPKTIEERQSIERLDDQLIQKIFYYFPFEDKIHLLYLNKRLMNCLSESQLDLTIDHKIGNQYNSWYQLEMSDSSLNDTESIEDEEDSNDEELDYFLKANKIALKFILKTFKGIETIDLCNSSLDNQTVALICDNFCPNLKVLKFTDFGITDKSVTDLGQTYGKSLTKMYIQSSFSGTKLGFDKIFLNYCQNLVEIHCESIEMFIQPNDDFLPNLESITTFVKKRDDFDSLKQITQRYSHQLKSLTLFIQLEERTDRLDGERLDVISNLVALKSLNLDFFDWFSILEKIDKIIEKIAINCKEIESFRIGFNFCSSAVISIDLFKAFGLFSNLQRFSAQLVVSEKESQEKNVHKSIEELKNVDISCLKSLGKSLTHLDICFSEMTDKFIENIDSFLPNLISVRLSSAKELTDRSLNSLIKLKHLKSLKLSKNRFKKESFPEITDSGIENLLTRSPKLRSLTILGQPNITNKTVELFVQLAKKYPNKSYRFQCLYRDLDESHDQYLKDMDISSIILPKNMSLNIEGIDVSEDELFVTDSEDSEDSDDSEEGELTHSVISDEELPEYEDRYPI